MVDGQRGEAGAGDDDGRTFARRYLKLTSDHAAPLDRLAAVAGADGRPYGS
ncbi:hypothetical protein [Micromonospora sp. NPDC092111]|uniref:hypothetical protein n=1 Tax=Micromonospora sp. NPDC092111 TaxID=3364289 RepID=UPI0038050D9C